MEDIFNEIEWIQITETKITNLENNNIVKSIIEETGCIRIKNYELRNFTEIAEFMTSSGIGVDKIMLTLRNYGKYYSYDYAIHEITTDDWTYVTNNFPLKYDYLVRFMRGIVKTNCQIYIRRIGKSEIENLVKIMMEEVEKKLSRTDAKLMDMFANLI